VFADGYMCGLDQEAIKTERYKPYKVRFRCYSCSAYELVS